MTSKKPAEPENISAPRPETGVTQAYLTRAQVAALYPISIHTLAALASQGLGPRFYKPTDKALYLARDIEDWIAAAVIVPRAAPTSTQEHHKVPPLKRGRGRAFPKPRPTGEAAPAGRGRKSLPPSPRSALLRPD